MRRQCGRDHDNVIAIAQRKRRQVAGARLDAIAAQERFSFPFAQSGNPELALKDGAQFFDDDLAG